MSDSSPAASPVSAHRWTAALLALAVLISLGLGFSRLDRPSYWHDELVHVFVAKNLVAHAWPALPSGQFYPSSTAYNLLLAAVVALFGDGEAATRSLSVLLGALNVLLTYHLLRPLVGARTALLAAFLLALSPWHVAWARQARMYQLQMTAYLLMALASWKALEPSQSRAAALRWAGLAVAGYLLGLFSSWHSLLFLGGVGAYALCGAAWERDLRGRHSLAVALITSLGLASLAMLYFNPNPVDQAAVFQTGLGGQLVDQERQVRWYYLRWLNANLSAGFVALALLGTAWVVWKERARGLYLALLFWAPVMVLTFGIGYRHERFMFFAYPAFVALGAYSLYTLSLVVAQYRRSLLHAMAALVISVFLARVAVSEIHLVRDSLTAARGADFTLARRQPQWRKPGLWIREHRDPADAVLATTYLPAFYYAGRVDNWFPNRYTKWEWQDSGLPGLDSLEALQAFLREHPQGFFIAEYARFEQWEDHTELKQLREEVTWVREHMTRVDEASSRDVTVYRWNMPLKQASP